MFNLVLTLITIAFLGIGGYAALHADGGALLMNFERLSDKTTLVRLVNEAQQIGAAQRFHVAVKGTRAESPEELVRQGFLKALPVPPAGTEGPWVFDTTRGAVLMAFAPGADVERFASRICAMAPEMGGAAQLLISGDRPAQPDLEAADVVFGCAQSIAGNASIDRKTWFIHGF